MITSKNRNLLIFAAVAVTASITIGTLTSSYIQQAVSAQNQNNNSAGVTSLRNLTGSVQVFPRLSQIIQSKANVSLSAAATSAQTAVGANSHVISAHLGVVNGFLVYVAHVVDANNNIHGVIVDAGNGKVLSAIQLPFAGGLIHPYARGMFGHNWGGSGGGMYGHNQGLSFGHRGLRGSIGTRM
jgi:uncharacterized membrane protein YkoI